MNSFKKLAALVLSLSLVFTSAAWVNAAQVSTKFNKTYTETFSDETKVFGGDGIFETVQNVTDDSVKVVSSNQGGKHLEITSGGKDVQIRTKKGIFKHKVTVVDMVVSAVQASAFPMVRLTNNGAKMDKGNGLFRFVDANTNIRSYNQATGSFDIVSLKNEWVNVRIVLDSENNRITTSYNGSQVTTVSEMSSGWNNADVQLYFQVASNSKIRIDDVVISDGTYSENIYMTHDFEHSTTVNAQVGELFFYNINKNANPTLVYDESTNNSYLSVAKGSVIFGSNNIDTLNSPVVVEMDIKVAAGAGATVELKRSGNSAITPLFNKNELKADGTFHKYRAVVLPLSAGYKVIMFVDNNYVGFKELASGAYCGTDARYQITADSAADAGIDNLKIFYPQAAQIFAELDGQTDVTTDAVIELVSNTPINAESAKNAVITANGEAVSFTTATNADKNSYIFNIDGGLKKGKTYVITTAGMKDMYEQQYNATITFDTEVEPPVIGGEDSMFQFGANANNDNVEYVESAQGGKNLKVTSTNNTDVQINTKKGLFAYPVTVVNMSLRAGISGDFPQIKLMNNGVKFGKQSLLIFTGNTLRPYDVMNGTYAATTSTNEWKDVRIILDSVNQTISAAINGGEAVKVSNMPTAWDNKDIQFNFQVVNNSSILIDDMTITDGAYIDGVCVEEIFYDHDFEHSGKVGAEVGANFFYDINKSKNPVVVYDEASDNTYLEITEAPANEAIYTNYKVDTSASDVVVSVDMKTTGSSIRLKRSANSAVTPLFADTEVIADGNFHNYKAVVYKRARGYCVAKYVDGTLIGYNKEDDGAYSGTDMRFEILANASGTNLAIDNLLVYKKPGVVEGNISYTVNGEAPVDNKFAAEDTIAVTFNLKANTREGGQARGYYAYYDENGEMNFVQFVTLETEDAHSDTKTVSLENIPSDVKTVKLFLWTNDVTPLTECVDIVK